MEVSGGVSGGQMGPGVATSLLADLQQLTGRVVLVPRDPLERACLLLK